MSALRLAASFLGRQAPGSSVLAWACRDRDISQLTTIFRPGLTVPLVIFSASTPFGVYQLAANTALVGRVPPERRSQAFGIASTGVVVGQGLTG